MVYGHPAIVGYSKRDRYGRIVGRVEVDGRDVNLDQLREGSAWVYLQYIRELTKTDQRLYLDAEKQARNDSLGLWQDHQPEPPWEWRKTTRSRHASQG